MKNLEIFWRRAADRYLRSIRKSVQTAWLSEGNEDHEVKGEFVFIFFFNDGAEYWLWKNAQWRKKLIIVEWNNVQCENLNLNIRELGNLEHGNNLKQEKEHCFETETKIMMKTIFDIRKEHNNLAEDN